MSAIMESSRREALGVAVLWVLMCLWVCGAAILMAYKVEAQPALILGMPGWVFWSVIAPWFVCLAVTVWAAFYGIRDEDLGEDHASEELPHGLADLQHEGHA